MSKQATIRIYEQDLFGVPQYRVMRDGTGLVFGRIMTDFQSREEAELLVHAHLRRTGEQADVVFVPITTSSDCY